jgi:hypothetical protein
MLKSTFNNGSLELGFEEQILETCRENTSVGSGSKLRALALGNW